jgi:UDP-N-acetylmuramate dehydrogenase
VTCWLAAEFAAIEVAAAELGSLASRDVALAPLTTYRVGGPAAIFVRPTSVADLDRVAAALARSGLPSLVVGRGSNLLVADRGFAGIAISLTRLGGEVQIDGAEVTAGAAVALPVLARRTAAAGVTGFEWAVGVPGSIGGAVRMNAGGHGSDMASSLIEIHRFDLRTRHHGPMSGRALGLRFRGSALGDHEVVLSARLALEPGDRATSEAMIDDIVRWRRDNQPGGQNAGSVFVNPVPGEVAAGQLIDRAGLRGFAIGTAHVSEKHANFIQAADGGTAADVRAVIEFVRARVAETSGHLMRSEVRLVGFDDVPIEHAEHGGG